MNGHAASRAQKEIDAFWKNRQKAKMTSIEIEAIRLIILDQRLQPIRGESPAEREIAEAINRVLEGLTFSITEDEINRYVQIVQELNEDQQHDNI